MSRLSSAWESLKTLDELAGAGHLLIHNQAKQVLQLRNGEDRRQGVMPDGHFWGCFLKDAEANSGLDYAACLVFWETATFRKILVRNFFLG